MGYYDLKKDTPLYIDSYIALELLHITHDQFLKLPRVERMKARTYILVKGAKRQEEIVDSDIDSGGPKSVPPK